MPHNRRRPFLDAKTFFSSFQHNLTYLLNRIGPAALLLEKISPDSAMNLPDQYSELIQRLVSDVRGLRKLIDVTRDFTSDADNHRFLDTSHAMIEILSDIEPIIASLVQVDTDQENLPDYYSHGVRLLMKDIPKLREYVEYYSGLLYGSSTDLTSDS